MFPSDPLPWKILQQRYTLDRSPYMILREDTVELATGAIIPDYFVFEYPDWVSVLAVTEAGELLLIRQYRHGIGGVHYELVAGVVDADATLLENAKRELLEETGYGGGKWEYWMAVSANPATHTNMAHLFLARGVRRMGIQALEHTEEITVHLVSPAQLPQLLLSGAIMQAIHAAALWRYVAEEQIYFLKTDAN
jgi:8-oxo-dGTP pyrophosphatase MutT (NUDIX family)